MEKNRKGLALLLLGILCTTAPIWLRHFNAGSHSNFLQGFLQGFGIVVMIAAVVIIIKARRQSTK